jgi:NDP-sugar pyrophosphorylase family protein
MSGMSSRFTSAGYSIPKFLIEIDGKLVIEHIVNLYPKDSEFIFIVNDKHEKETNVIEVLESLVEHKTIKVIVSHKKGPVFSVCEFEDLIDDEEQVIINYCDFSMYWDYNHFEKFVNETGCDGSVICYTGFHPHMLGSDNYAFCKVNLFNEILEVREKQPFTDDKMSEYASNGTYYFKSGKMVKKYFKELIDLDINLKGEYYVSLVYNLLVRDGLKVNIFEIENMLQWGTPYDLEIYKGWSNYFSKPELPTIKHNDDVTLVLPMAGRGSRFSECGYELPKPLIDVDGLPMIIKAVKCLPQCDNNTFICLGEHIDKYKLDEILLRE